MKVHAIREAVKDEEVDVQHGSAYSQLTDIFTKCLSKDKFTFLRSELGIRSSNTKEMC